MARPRGGLTFRFLHGQIESASPGTASPRRWSQCLACFSFDGCYRNGEYMRASRMNWAGHARYTRQLLRAPVATVRSVVISQPGIINQHPSVGFSCRPQQGEMAKGRAKFLQRVRLAGSHLGAPCQASPGRRRESEWALHTFIQGESCSSGLRSPCKKLRSWAPLRIIALMLTAKQRERNENPPVIPSRAVSVRATHLHTTASWLYY